MTKDTRKTFEANCILSVEIQAGSDRMAAACETTQQAYNEVSQLQNALSNREMELCQLKAKLYDLEHK